MNDNMLAEFNRFVYAIWSFVFYINPNDSARMAEWRAQDIAEMQESNELDANAVGKMIGVGMQHRIYEYHAQTMVLKVATPVPILRFPSFADAQSDVEMIARYFEPYQVLATRIISLRAGRYVIQQRRLEKFAALTSARLKDESLRAQFLDIVERNRVMQREVGRSLDFLGREGQRKCRAAFFGLRAMPTIANVVSEIEADGAKQLRIMDTDLEHFYPRAMRWRERRAGFAARVAVSINRFFIKRFFGFDIG